MYKKQIIAAIIAISALINFSAGAFAQYSSGSQTEHRITMVLGDAYMYVDGVRKEIDPGRGTIAETIYDRTMIPIRAVAEEIGGAVGWEEENQTVTIKINSKEIRIKIGNSILYVNGSEVYMDVIPVIKNDRTLVPARFAAEQMGCIVDWDDSARMVIITYSKPAPPADGGLQDETTQASAPTGAGVLASAVVSPDNTVISEPGGVSIDFSSSALGDPATATIKAVTGLPAVPGAGGTVKAYDFTLEGRTEIRGVARIGIPLAKGAGEIPCAGYYNAASKEWEPVAAFYDGASGRVIIDATHLSTYAAFKITDAAQANAMLSFIAPNEQAEIGDALKSIDKDLATLNSMGAYERGSATSDSLVKTGAEFVKNFAQGVELSDHAGTLLNFSWLDYAADSAGMPIDYNLINGYKFDLTDVGLVAAVARLSLAANNGGFNTADKKVALKALPDWILGKIFNLFGGPVCAALNIIYFVADKALDLLTGTVLDANMERYMSLANVYYKNVAPRTDAQWYDKLAPIMQGAQNQAQRDAQIKNELDSRFGSFWADDANYAAAIAEGSRLGILGEGWMGGAVGAGATPEVQKKVSDALRDDFIKNDLARIMDACAKNAASTQLQLRNKKLADLTKKLNREITLRLRDDSRSYDGREFRLETSKGVSTPSWRGVVKGAETDFEFTFAGFITADMPNHLCVYEGENKLLDIPFTVSDARIIQVDLTASSWKFEPSGAVGAVFDVPVRLQLKGSGLGANVSQVNIEFSNSDGDIYGATKAPVINGNAEAAFEYTFERPIGYGQGYGEFKTDVIATITDAATGAPLGKAGAEIKFNIPLVKITGDGVISVNDNSSGSAQVTFYTTVTVAGNYIYTWDFGDGAIINAGASVTHTYDTRNAKQFAVWVTLYNADGSGIELSSDTALVAFASNSDGCGCSASGCTGGPGCACNAQFCYCNPINVTVVAQ